jgi:hypothetical protein
VDARIPETYQWLLVPGQPDPKGPVEWSESRQQGQDPLAARASRKMKSEEMLLVQLGGTRLRHEINNIPLWRGNHVGIRQLIEDFATYLYLPRLRDADVLIGAIENGLSLTTWDVETFAYAQGWDEKRQRYEGLVAGQHVTVIADDRSLLVISEAAATQMEEERREREAATAGVGASGTGEPGE